MLRLILISLSILLFSLPGFCTDLVVTQGDTPTFTMTLQTGAGANYDLTGGAFQTQILGKNGTVVTLGNSAHTPDPDQVTNKGKLLIALTAANTLALLVGPEHEIVTRVTQGGTVTFFHAKNVLTVLPQRPEK